MTLRYSHLSPTHTLEAVNKLCGLSQQVAPELAPARMVKAEREAKVINFFGGADRDRTDDLLKAIQKPIVTRT
jgi:hypothetical protein